MRRRIDQPQRLRIVGRLPALKAWRVPLCVLACGAWSASCRDDASQAAARAASRERSEVVAAKGEAAEPKASSAVSPAAPAPAPTTAAPRKLCDGQLGKPGRDLTKKPLARKAAPGARNLSATLSSGKWLWINLWAAWCAPCKEEMPRLTAFSSRLAQAGHDVTLAFVSLDDDERQLEQFLAAPGEGLVHATYWLRDGRERDDWLGAMGLPKAPDLPVQLLVDPRGKIRCTVHGAIEDGDFAEIAAAFAAP
jgi:thiol-disulfide isomerase/thioredoxin